PALLPPARREFGDRLRRLCQPAEPGPGRQRRAGRASGPRRDVRAPRRQPLPPAGAAQALNPPRDWEGNHPKDGGGGVARVSSPPPAALRAATSPSREEPLEIDRE